MLNLFKVLSKHGIHMHEALNAFNFGSTSIMFIYMIHQVFLIQHEWFFFSIQNFT